MRLNRRSFVLASLILGLTPAIASAQTPTNDYLANIEVRADSVTSPNFGPSKYKLTSKLFDLEAQDYVDCKKQCVKLVKWKTSEGYRFRLHNPESFEIIEASYTYKVFNRKGLVIKEDRNIWNVSDDDRSILDEFEKFNVDRRLYTGKKLKKGERTKAAVQGSLTNIYVTLRDPWAPTAESVTSSEPPIGSQSTQPNNTPSATQPPNAEPVPECVMYDTDPYCGR